MKSYPDLVVTCLLSPLVEYSSVSSSRNGATSYTETSMSGAQSERRTSSSLYGSATETSSSYQTAVSGSSGDTRIAKLALTATETGKPKFVRTIEGISAERKYFVHLAIIIVQM